MRVELIKWEIKKLWSLPMFVIFLLICIVFNYLLLAEGACLNERVNYIRYVSKVTKEIGGQMGAEFENILAGLPEQDEKKMLLAETSGRKNTFEGYHTAEIADFYIGKFHIKGFTAEALERKYQKLQVRVEELAKKDAALSLSAAGVTKKLLDNLFGKLCRAVITEGILLAVFLALYACGNDEMQHTQSIVYTTKTGRYIQREKWTASLISAVLAYGLLAGSMLLAFAGVWRLGAIWKGNMSSQFYYVVDLAVKLPFVSWADFSIAGYLAAVLALGAVTVTVFHSLGFFAGLMTHHAYRGFLLFFVLMVLNFEMILLTGDSGLWGLYEIVQWSPMALWAFQPLWFSELGASTLVAWQECWVALFCIGVCALLLIAAFQHFYKKEL